jgi:hypothetical protein
MELILHRVIYATEIKAKGGEKTTQNNFILVSPTN